jgi:hypothetical protein
MISVYENTNLPYITIGIDRLTTSFIEASIENTIDLMITGKTMLDQLYIRFAANMQSVLYDLKIRQNVSQDNKLTFKCSTTDSILLYNTLINHIGHCSNPHVIKQVNQLILDFEIFIINPVKRMLENHQKGNV